MVLSMSQPYIPFALVFLCILANCCSVVQCSAVQCSAANVHA
jgi:hypothetical protein